MTTMMTQGPLIGIVMGSDSDWQVMQAAAQVFDEFGVPHEARVVSAHRTPDLLFEYATTARARTAGDYRRGRRCSAPPRDARGKDAATGTGRAGAVEASARP